MNGRPGRSRQGGEEGASRPRARTAHKAPHGGARRPDPRGLAGRIAELRQRDAGDPARRWFLPLAGALVDAGSPVDAAQVLRQGLARDPECLGGWVLLGQCYAALEEWAAARRVFDVVIGRDRENAVALRGLAALHARLGDRGQAAAYCRALLRLAPRDLAAQEALAELLDPGAASDPEDARGQRMAAGPVLSLVEPEPPPARKPPRLRFGRRLGATGVEPPAGGRERLLPEATPRPGLFEPPPADLEPDGREAHPGGPRPRRAALRPSRPPRPAEPRGAERRSTPSIGPRGYRSLDGYRRWLERMTRDGSGPAGSGGPPAAKAPPAKALPAQPPAQPPATEE